MLIILDCLIPRYLGSFKEETDRIMASHKQHTAVFGDLSGSGGGGSRHGGGILGGPGAAGSHLHTELVHQARAEFALIQKISVSIKTLVNTSDFLARIYAGIKIDSSSSAAPPKTPTNQASHSGRHNRSPSIMPDEDSMRFNDDKRGRPQNDLTGDEFSYQFKHEFRSPRDTLLNIVSEFVFFSSKRIKELYKVINDPNLKVGQILDSKAHCRLVEIANALLKLWEDPSILSGNGLQKYEFLISLKYLIIQNILYLILLKLFLVIFKNSYLLLLGAKKSSNLHLIIYFAVLTECFPKSLKDISLK